MKDKFITIVYELEKELQVKRNSLLNQLDTKNYENNFIDFCFDLLNVNIESKYCENEEIKNAFHEFYLGDGIFQPEIDDMVMKSLVKVHNLDQEKQLLDEWEMCDNFANFRNLYDDYFFNVGYFLPVKVTQELIQKFEFPFANRFEAEFCNEAKNREIERCVRKSQKNDEWERE